MTKKQAERIASAIEDLVDSMIADSGEHEMDYIGSTHVRKQTLIDELVKVKSVTVVKR